MIAALVRHGLTRRLVGLRLPVGPPLPQACNLTVRNNEIVGRVTSVADSDAVGHIIGLAYVALDNTATKRTIRAAPRARRT